MHDSGSTGSTAGSPAAGDPHAGDPHAGGAQEPHRAGLSGRLNWLRAGVLGANDGIVSTASLVLGVAGATTSTAAIITAGLAGLFAGALSMAAGEYVSVSSQRDSERAMLDLEKRELREAPRDELAELTGLYQAKGLTPELARKVARQLTAHDALAAHAEAELGIDPDELVSPWQAALASFLSFAVGAALPVLAIALTPQAARIAVTAGAVLVALVVTGTASAALGKAPKGRAVARNVIGGAIAMGVTYGIGSAIGATV
jgi:VIT1/CCC1 family predicted Fe2+/Mn2+ transporter